MRTQDVVGPTGAHDPGRRGMPPTAAACSNPWAAVAVAAVVATGGAAAGHAWQLRGSWRRERQLRATRRPRQRRPRWRPRLRRRPQHSQAEALRASAVDRDSSVGHCSQPSAIDRDISVGHCSQPPLVACQMWHWRLRVWMAAPRPPQSAPRRLRTPTRQRAQRRTVLCRRPRRRRGHGMVLVLHPPPSLQTTQCALASPRAVAAGAAPLGTSHVLGAPASPRR